MKFVKRARCAYQRYENHLNMSVLIYKWFEMHVKFDFLAQFIIVIFRFLFSATALIMQRNGAALHSSTSCFWYEAV